MNFKERYPISLKDAIRALIVFRQNPVIPTEVPFPSLKGIRLFVEYAGYNYGAMRTAISRSSKRGELLVENTEGVKRYKMGKGLNYLVNTYQNYKKGEGYTLVIYSYSKKEDKEAYSIRELLEEYGFKKISQGVYINMRMDIQKLKNVFKERDLDTNLFFFDCAENVDPVMRQKLISLWDIDELTKNSLEFEHEVKEFLEYEDMEISELFNRLLYVSVAFHIYCHSKDPPISNEYLPKEYALQRIDQYLFEIGKTNWESIFKYYLAINIK